MQFTMASSHPLAIHEQKEKLLFGFDVVVVGVSGHSNNNKNEM